jgi:hypothetical protein
VAGVIAKVEPSVVSVDARTTRFPGLETTSAGTGIILSSGGEVRLRALVVNGTHTITVTLISCEFCGENP